jgi:hypothetical protein
MQLASRAEPLSFLPISAENHATYEAAARRIMGETLPKLRALRPRPTLIQQEFDYLYGVMEVGPALGNGPSWRRYLQDGARAGPAGRYRSMYR